MKIRIVLLALATALISTGELSAQKTKKSKKRSKTEQAEVKPAAGTIESVITAKAKRSDGMLTVFEQEGKYYFLIPSSLLGRDILVVNRLSKAAAGQRSRVGYAGDEIFSDVIRFGKSPDGKNIFINKLQMREIPRDTMGSMYRTVMQSNLQPIVEAFEIKGQNTAKDSLLIDVTAFMNGDSELVGFDPYYKDDIKLSQLLADRSYIGGVKTYPINIEIKTTKTYMRSIENPYTGRTMAPVATTYEINSSMMLLPEVPMQARYYDPRVGYFTERYVDYDKNPQGVKNIEMITRWRLEPKPEDVEKYMAGELVEPIKPIIYYIDPATPQKWVKYLKQGVDDWEPVFRRAGFKNAIMGLEAPVGDSTWSLEDSRYSAIVYKASNIPNASGPHNRDPRSGEILESHVNWYHNVMLILRNWYMLQAGPNDPEGRKMEFSDELMGQLIRFVSSHEIGHTLGLRHNFGSTSSVPVDSLRNREYLLKYGHTPSIMDYSRFNYVVQPEDGIEPSLQYPRIQDYDNWAIEWGYRRFPDLKTPESEKAKLNAWVIEKQKNPRLWFGQEQNPNDPRSQSEDLGDNQMKANTLGILNLQRVIIGLPSWTAQPDTNYDNLEDIYTEVVQQYMRYVAHVTKWVGGVYENPVTREQAPVTYTVVEREKQKEAMVFLEKELYTTPRWLLDQSIFDKTGLDGMFVMSRVYESNIGSILSTRVLSNLIDAEVELGKKAYTQTDLYGDLNRIIFAAGTPDAYRRLLQKTYVNTIIARSGLEDSPSGITVYSGGSNRLKNTDIESFATYQLRQLQVRLSAMTSSDPVVAAHYQHMAMKINLLLKK